MVVQGCNLRMRIVLKWLLVAGTTAHQQKGARYGDLQAAADTEGCPHRIGNRCVGVVDARDSGIIERPHKLVA